MEFVRDRVLYELLSDPNNNNEVNPVLYVCRFYAQLRQDVDIATEEKLISLKSTEVEKIERLEKHRDTILSLIGEHEQKTLSKCRENFDKFKLSLNNFVQSVLSPKESNCQEEEKAKEKENYGAIGKLYLLLKQEIFGEDLFYFGWRVSAKDYAFGREVCSECQQFPGVLILVRQSCLDDLQIATLNENSTAQTQHSAESVDNYLMQIWTLYLSIRGRKTLQPSETFSDEYRKEKFQIYLNNSKKLKKNTFHNLITPILEIISRSLESIENGTFDNLSHTKMLAIIATQIEHFEKGLFENLNELKVLELQGNKMKYLHSWLFNGLSNLESLNLNNNKLTEFRPNCFKRIPKLKRLDFATNNLTRIKRSDLVEMTCLTYLNLWNNSISRVQSFSFASLVNLTELNLRENSILQVKIGTFKGLVNLKKLDLVKNGIRVLQSFAFQDLKKLELLNLRENRLSRIEANHFYGLKNLIELNLRFNSIRSIEEGAFKHFDNIELIDLYETSEHLLKNI